MARFSRLKFFLAPAIGFGIGGALWGWSLYKGIPETDYPLTLPEAILLGIFGGLGLSIWSKDIKKILKSCGLGIMGCVVGAFIAVLGIYYLETLGIFILGNSIAKIFDYEPSIRTLGVGTFWINFVTAGFFIGLFFSFAFSKIWPMVWRGAVGFGLAAIISPIFGNLLGNLFNSLLASYLITFSLIGIILGIFLGWGVYKEERSRI